MSISESDNDNDGIVDAKSTTVNTVCSFPDFNDVDSIPTLNQWGLLILGLILVNLSTYFLITIGYEK